MVLNFDVLKRAVDVQLSLMSQGELFFVDVDKDTLYDTYLGSFPEGTNPMFRERTEHDCSCCRQFIKNIGRAVAIIDGQLVSVWDINVGCQYQPVVDALSALVKSHPITGIYRNDSVNVGTDHNYEITDEGQKRWDHFFFQLPNKFVMSGEDQGTFRSEYEANYSVLKRSLEEINLGACEVVEDLISQNSLYKGAEFKKVVTDLKNLIREYEQVGNDLWLWMKSAEIKAYGRFKNTVIGTLLSDISEGVDLETAVKMYESKTAPSNYKRPKALITQRMIDKAYEKVTELGLESALERRHANLTDITVNNLLFADRTTKKALGAFDGLAPTKSEAKPKLDDVKEVNINDFIDNILPNAESLEIMLENKHTGNLVSVVAPVNQDVNQLFKWDNNFSWSYNGEVTDSMRERVKQAGGSVTGDLRFSIKWNDEDECKSDLDAHCRTPDAHIYFSNKKDYRNKGELDIDITNPTGVAVENITFEDRKYMSSGDYRFSVHNFSKRGGRSSFTAQIEYDGVIYDYHYDKDLSNGTYQHVATVNLSNGVFSMKQETLKNSTASKEVWNINTNKWTKVSAVMQSPNHWDGQEAGNKHWFFILDNCKNPDSVRGFYNEFLKPELNEHRKVLEVLASKMKADYTEDQLSGVGFSSTQENNILCKVGGKFNRVIKIKI